MHGARQGESFMHDAPQLALVHRAYGFPFVHRVCHAACMKDLPSKKPCTSVSVLYMCNKRAP